MTPERLALIPLFARLKPATRAALLERAEERQHAPGDTILSRAAPTSSFIFLIEGKWTARRFVQGLSEPLIWSDQTAGAWLSGVAALDVIAPADVFADKPTTVLLVPREDMLAAIPEDPALALAILRDIHVWSERLDVHVALGAARS
jgi:CRP-like cAMP-binding protein